MVKELPRVPVKPLMPDHEYKELLNSFMQFSGKYAVLLKDMQVKDGQEYVLIEKGSLVKLHYAAESPGYFHDWEQEGRQWYYCNTVEIEAYESKTDDIGYYIAWARPDTHFSPDTDEECLQTILDAMDFIYANFGTGPELDKVREDIEKYENTFWDYNVSYLPASMSMFVIVLTAILFGTDYSIAIKIIVGLFDLLIMAYIGNFFYKVKIFKIKRKPIEAWKKYDKAITDYARNIPPDTSDLRSQMLTMATRLLPDHSHDSQPAGATSAADTSSAE